MKFESEFNEYEVINLIDSLNLYDIYLCKCKKRKYIICRIKSESLKKDVLELFLDMKNKGEFDDLSEIFTDREDLIIVFVYNNLQDGLENYLEDLNKSFEQKLDFFYNVLSCFCVHQTAVCVACDLLKYNNVGIRSDGTMDCFYQLKEMAAYKEFDMKRFSQILSEKLKTAFKYELEDKRFLELKLFLHNLTENVSSDIMELFKQYCKIYELFKEKISKGSLNDESKKQKALKLFKRVTVIFKLLAAAVVLAAAAWLVVSQIKEKSEDGGSSFETIGEIIIEEYSG